jgi:uncharacterized membrane protein
MHSQGGSRQAMTDEKLELIIGNLLRAGVMVSATIVLLAGIAFLVQHHGDPVTYSSFHLEQSDLRTLTGIFQSAFELHADAIIQLGLVLLVATPIARVALAALGFYLEGDRLYLAVSLIVLSILLFSIIRAS